LHIPSSLEYFRQKNPVEILNSVFCKFLNEVIEVNSESSRSSIRIVCTILHCYKHCTIEMNTSVKLSNGQNMPLVGFGTNSELGDVNLVKADVCEGLKFGYRRIECGGTKWFRNMSEKPLPRR
jgi:hypothetical protein